jgi:diguanylate cyclase (GGDEF)-like protein
VFQVFNCLTTEHNWRLVALASAVCLLASLVAISLFNRAQATQGRTRLIWLALDAIAAGFGIWATHFIAMLAYDPSWGVGYNLGLTIISLVFAIVITVIGLNIALLKTTGSAVTGGVIIGAGIGAMHYTGMMALEVAARITWSSGLVLASLVLGCLFAATAFRIAVKHDGPGFTVAAAILLCLAILSHHFTAMGALVLVPDPTQTTDTASLSPTSLALTIAGLATIILGMCLVAALGDRRSQDRLRQQKMLLDTALENMSQGLCMFDADGRITLFNERFVSLMRFSKPPRKGTSLLDLLTEARRFGELDVEPEQRFESILSVVRTGKSSSKVITTSMGRVLRIAEQPMQGGGWVATFEDITESRKAQEQIAHMALHDALTELPNRTKFRQQLELALRRARRDENICVLCIDLDHFKEINDSLGHPIGDELLKEVSRRLLGCARDGDTVARLGGDEFAVVQIANSPDASAASAFAGRIVEALGAPYDIQDHHIVIGASVGIASAPEDGNDPDRLLKNADMALYRAKEDGRGNYRFFEAGMDARAQARRLMETELRAALARDEFEVYYQPIHNLEANQIIAFEALVRWNHPLRGMIPPTSFIPLAEETGLIVAIGDWVLRRACADAAGWSKEVCVAVNLSPVQFRNPNLVMSVIAALTASGLPARRLELEITESVLLQDSEATLAKLHSLRGSGVKISMDDFGTGYSSLSYLRSFPFDRIKIDRSFINELATRNDSMAIVRAVAGLGKSLGISTTAEGVETKEQLALLRSEGCTDVQGYLFSVPRPAADVEWMLRGGRPRVVA